MAANPIGQAQNKHVHVDKPIKVGGRGGTGKTMAWVA